MNNTNKILDNYKKICLLTSDNAAAAKLGLTRATISGWRHEKSHANAEAVERMCTAIDEPLEKWLPLIEAERARTPADRKVWLRLAQAVASIAALATLIHYGSETHNAAGLMLSPLYIMRN